MTAFEEEGDQSSFPTFTRGFTRSLIIALTRFTGLRVFGAETALRHPADIDPNGRPAGARRRLPGHRPDLAPAGPLRGGRPARRGGERPRGLGRDLRAAAPAVRDHRAAQRGGEPRRAGAGPALRRDPGRPRARRRRTGPRDARQLRGGAAFLCLLADLRPRDDRGGARRPRARRGGRARLRRGARLPVAGLFQRLPLPPSDRRARPGPAATGPSRSPPARSSSRQARAGRATPSASPAGSPATPPAPSMRWRPAAG